VVEQLLAAMWVGDANVERTSAHGRDASTLNAENGSWTCCEKRVPGLRNVRAEQYHSSCSSR
jgi:hypothetical protein